MNRLLSVFLVLLVLFFVVPIVTVDKLVTDGTYTLNSGETLHGGLVMTAGDVTIAEGARVVGGVFKSSGVLTVNGEIGGGILSTSGEVRLGPSAVVGGHVKVLSVPYTQPEGARVENSATADVAGWLGAEMGAALKLLVLAAIILYRPAILGMRPVPGAPKQVLAAQPTLALAAGLLLIAVGVFLPLNVLEISVSAGMWAAILIGAGLLLIVMTAVRTDRDTGVLLPAGVLTVAGLVLLYQAVTGHWESWVYAWALVLPAGIGAGQMLAGWWSKQPRLEHTGMRVAAAGVVLFVLAAAYFEGVVRVSAGAAALVASLLMVSAGFYLIFGGGPRPGGRPAGA